MCALWGGNGFLPFRFCRVRLCGRTIKQLVKGDSVEGCKCDKVVGVGGGFATLPFADGLTAHTELVGERLLREAGGFSSINEALRHRGVHIVSFRGRVLADASVLSVRKAPRCLHRFWLEF